jgi:hypothetical protein
MNKQALERWMVITLTLGVSVLGLLRFYEGIFILGISYSVLRILLEILTRNVPTPGQMQFSEETENIMKEAILDYAMQNGVTARIETGPNNIVQVVAIDEEQGVMVKMCDFVICEASPNTEEWRQALKTMTDKVDEFVSKTREQSKASS